MNFLTELREGLAISWSAIRANKMRSVLTTLGIVIGIVTVTLMGTTIEGINHAFLNSISNIGTDVLYVDRDSWFIETRQEWLETMKRPERLACRRGRAATPDDAGWGDCARRLGQRVREIQQTRFHQHPGHRHDGAIPDDQRPERRGGALPVCRGM